jgi:hypothetical protein
MKITALTLLLAFVGLIMPASLNAQGSAGAPIVTTPTARPAAPEREEATGTITDVTPERSLVLHTGTNAGEPIVFRFAPQVTYVDEDGRVVEAAGLRKNLRVRVSYVKAGADNVIEKVTILQ